MDIHTQLIARLKQQTRHGAKKPPITAAVGAVADLALSAAQFTIGAAAVISLKDAYAELFTQQSEIAKGTDVYLNGLKGLTDTIVAAQQQTYVLETRNKELNKSFGINSITAAKLGSKLMDIATNLKLSSAQINGYASNIKKMLPTLDQMTAAGSEEYKGLIRIQQVMTTNLGLSEEQAEKYTGFAMQRGKDAQESLISQYNLSKAIEDSTGMMGSFKMISEGIAETSEDVQLQYGKMPGNLELAIVKASKLGFKMGDLKKTADNLLNIESSIGQELEYQLLSGRRLVGNDKARSDLRGKSLTNAYREATLQGDASKQANVLNTILEQEGKTLENNLFARKQMSELLGMDEAALARALQKKSILEKLPGGEALFDETGDALLKAAKSLGATDDDMEKLIGGLDTRTIDQKILTEIQILTDVLVKKLVPDMEATVKGAREANLKSIRKTGFSDKTMDTLPSAQTIGNLANVAQGLNQVLSAKELGVKVLSGITGTRSGDMNKVQPAGLPVTTGEDILSPPSGYGTRTLMGPEGAIQLNNKDTVIAGTNLFDKSATTNTGSDKELANTMLQVGAMIVAAIKSGGVNLNERFA
jgi:hypothetical protein